MSCAMRYHVCSQPFISCTTSLLLLIFHVICRLLLCLFNLSVLCIANNSYYRYSPTPRGVGCRVYSVFFSSLSVFSDTYICPRLDANLSIIISLCFLIMSTKTKNLFLMFVHILCWGWGVLYSCHRATRTSSTISNVREDEAVMAVHVCFRPNTGSRWYFHTVPVLEDIAITAILWRLSVIYLR